MTMTISARNRPLNLLPGEISSLNSICTAPTNAGIQAGLWLNAIGEQDFVREYSLPELDGSSKTIEKDGDVKQETVENELVLIFPNPATDQLFVEMILSDQIQTATIRVLDIMTGALIGEYPVIERGSTQMLVNTSPLPSGVYVLQLVAGEKIAGYEKLIITR